MLHFSDKIYNKTVIIFFITAMIGVAVSYSKLYLFHLVYAGLGFILLFKFKDLMRKLPTKFHYFFIVFFLWYLMSTIWSINTGYSIGYMFYVFLGSTISLFTLFYIDSVEKMVKVLKSIGIVLVVEIIFSLLESFTSFRLPISPFSEISHFFGREGSLHLFKASEIESILVTPTGFRGNPNNLANMMILFLPFILFRKMNVYAKSIFVALILVVILMTGSRLVFIVFVLMLFSYLFTVSYKSLSIGILVFLVLSFTVNHYRKDLKKNVYGQKVIEIGSTYYAASNLIFGPSGTVDDDPDDVEIESGSVRRVLMINGWNALLDSKGLGVGGGGSIAVQEKYEGYVGKTVKSMHNFWFEMLVDAGFLFFGLFITWYIFILYNLRRVFMNSKVDEYVYVSKSAFFAMSFFVLSAISSSSVIYFIPMWILFGLSIAIINLWKNEKNQALASV
jgi:teichuronic acid biosynthesis protein TuaE